MANGKGGLYSWNDKKDEEEEGEEEEEELDV